ncbi:hypothetical protein OHA21_21540 [Actinoplanes sp. NBC_00393]|uniref:hypothetical protein n=1 Tax=Actinoplanes sp. NBC_00393 TaxID=2975953 RepID=UPI002E1C749F
MSLPPVTAEVTAEAVAALPARLRTRLDAAIEQARTWPISLDGDAVSVHPDDQTTVTLTTPVSSAADAVCSCLLAPRCLHRAAVLSTAPILTDEPIETESPVGTGARTEDAADIDAAPRAAVGDDAAAEGQSGSGDVGLTAKGPHSVRPEPSAAAAVSAAQRRAALSLASGAAAVLATGIPGAGALVQADLLRAVHQARATSLHSPAAAAIRVVEHLRAARRDDPAFRLADLTDALRELLVSCHRLTNGDAAAAGVSRRDYEPAGDLRLYGLFCEPVRAATGHAGAATYLVDARGRIWVVSDVKPADPATAVTATRASVDLGEVRLSHRELSRSGLLAINAHASAAGRLSHGRARQAVSAPGTGWFETPLNDLWQVGLAAQVDRWLTAATRPAHERPAAHDLAFLDGVILGADHRGLLLAVPQTAQVPTGADGPPTISTLPGSAPPGSMQTGSTRDSPPPGTHGSPPPGTHGSPPPGGTPAGHTPPHRTPAGKTSAGNTHGSTPTDFTPPGGFPGGTAAGGPADGHLASGSSASASAVVVAVVAAMEEPSLPYVANLRLLATRAVGHPVRLVGRFAGPRRIAGLAFAAGWLPERHGGHLDLGAGPLTRADLPTSAPEAMPDRPATGPPPPPAPPLHLLRHQLERVVSAGRPALLTGVGDDARRLGDAHLGAAAAVLAGLGAAGVRRTRDVFGRLDPHDAELLAQAWLTAAVYEQAATRAATRTAWT